MRDLQSVAEGGPGADVEAARDMLSHVRAAKSAFHQAATLQEAGRTMEALEMWEAFLESDRRSWGILEKGSISARPLFPWARSSMKGGERAYRAEDLVRASRLWKMGGQG